MVGAMVLHQLIRVEDVATNLASERDVGLRSLELVGGGCIAIGCEAFDA